MTQSMARLGLALLALLLLGLAWQSAHAAPTAAFRCPDGWDCHPRETAVPEPPVAISAPVQITIDKGQSVELTNGAAVTVTEHGFHVESGTITIKGASADIVPVKSHDER